MLWLPASSHARRRRLLPGRDGNAEAWSWDWSNIAPDRFQADLAPMVIGLVQENHWFLPAGPHIPILGWF